MAKKNKTYTGFKNVLGGPAKLIFGIKSHGEENIPRDRGVIICANHTALYDVIVMSAATDVQIRYMAKKELFSVPIIGKIITALGAYPVDRKGGDVAALRKTVAMLDEGSAVGIFPQGTRHPHEDPRETEVRHGVGLIAYRAKCDIVPVYIKTKGNHVRPFKKTDIYFGKPIPYEELGFENGGKEEYKNASEKIFDRICTMGEEMMIGEKC
ncbi:MAG: 1-acyl-sn-glycerol-3-phosphate acyltransferase [Ruminococcaceae bacterium]|nr:1-acyl-sn-glycerol-3-phosphate acyltransferase [Oscillospiraceae bacterium]